MRDREQHATVLEHGVARCHAEPATDAIAPRLKCNRAMTAKRPRDYPPMRDDDAARDRASSRPAPQQVDGIQRTGAGGSRAPRPPPRGHRRSRHAAPSGARAARRQDDRSRALHLPLAAAGHRRDAFLSRADVRPRAFHADRVHANGRRGVSEIRPPLPTAARPLPFDQTEGPPSRDPPQLAGARVLCIVSQSARSSASRFARTAGIPIGSPLYTARAAFRRSTRCPTLDAGTNTRPVADRSTWGSADPLPTTSSTSSSTNSSRRSSRVSRRADPFEDWREDALRSWRATERGCFTTSPGHRSIAARGILVPFAHRRLCAAALSLLARVCASGRRLLASLSGRGCDEDDAQSRSRCSTARASYGDREAHDSIARSRSVTRPSPISSPRSRPSGRPRSSDCPPSAARSTSAWSRRCPASMSGR